jgi:hypothetical protein
MTSGDQFGTMTSDRTSIEDVESEPEETRYQQIGPVRIRRDASVGPIMLVAVSLAGILAVLWGQLFADPGIIVTQFDAGRLDAHGIGQVVAFPELDLYVIGMADGRIRAVDGRLEGTECSVTYLPDDARGRSRNPNGVMGALEDVCTGGVWAMTGDAISGAEEPLRTPLVTFHRDDVGLLHVWVELITLDVSTGE